jgi:hypothetical protein
MLTRSRVFSGETVSDTIAAILERAPNWSALPVPYREVDPALQHGLNGIERKVVLRLWFNWRHYSNAEHRSVVPPD